MVTSKRLQLLSGPLRSCDWLQLVGVLAVFAILSCYGASRHSPTFDEPAHFVAGWSHWELGRFDLYNVNPPLVRMVATAPSRITGTDVDLTGYAAALRAEFSVGKVFLQSGASEALWQLTIARWACLPFSILGAWTCYQWSSELYGGRSGIVAAALWCFSPTVLAHSQFITPDIGSASLAAFAAYRFWKWLTAAEFVNAVCAGVFLGLAALAKATLLILLPLWPLLWYVYRWPGKTIVRREGKSMVGIVCLAMFVIHTGYGFEGSFTPLKKFHFVSRTLGGAEQFFDVRTTGNRFAGSWLGDLPAPLPRNYLLGIDMQQREFEERKWSHLRGEWRLGGWWYYYLYALVVKEPLALVGLAGIALSHRSGATHRDELFVVCPLLLLFGVVSSKTGFNHHYRYVLPALPFLFILVSRVVARQRLEAHVTVGHSIRTKLVGVLVVWYVSSSLYAYPHSLSYFNELAGGALGGPKHLQGSSTDWGQDLYYIRDWLDEHPEVGEFHLAWTATLIDPAIANIQAAAPPSLSQWKARREYNGDEQRKEKQWYLVSVNELYANSDKYAYFRDIEPTTRIGYTIYAFHLNTEDIYRSIDRMQRS